MVSWRSVSPDLSAAVRGREDGRKQARKSKRALDGCTYLRFCNKRENCGGQKMEVEMEVEMELRRWLRETLERRSRRRESNSDAGKK